MQVKQYRNLNDESQFGAEIVEKLNKKIDDLKKQIEALKIEVEV